MSHSDPLMPLREGMYSSLGVCRIDVKSGPTSSLGGRCSEPCQRGIIRQGRGFLPSRNELQDASQTSWRVMLWTIASETVDYRQ